MKPKSAIHGAHLRSRFPGLNRGSAISTCLGLIIFVGATTWIVLSSSSGETRLALMLVLALVVSGAVPRLFRQANVLLIQHWLKEIGILADDEAHCCPFDTLPPDVSRIRPYAVFRTTFPTTLTIGFRLAGERGKNSVFDERAYSLIPGRNVISPPAWLTLQNPAVGDGWRFTVTGNGQFLRGRKVFIAESRVAIHIDEDGEISSHLHQSIEGETLDLSLSALLQGDPSEDHLAVRARQSADTPTDSESGISLP